MSFLEYPRFPDRVAQIAHGGPTYSTSVVALKSGFEQRNQNWATSRGIWEFPGGAEEVSYARSLIAFFRVVKGRATGFRFRDPFDNAVSSAAGDGTLSRISAAVYQLQKAYAYGSMTDVRKITKPDSTVFALTRNGAVIASPALDSTTGLLTLAADSSTPITAITKANPGVATTSVAHGLVTGQLVTLSGITGMTAANQADLQALVLSPTTFSIGLDTTTFAAYAAGGTVSRFAQTQATTVVVSISGVTGAGATKTVATTVPHGLAVGQSTSIAGTVGLVGLNGNAYTVAAVGSATTFDIVTVGVSGAYTSGGTATYTHAIEDSLAWVGVFDVPCRFDHDDLKIGHSGGLIDWSGVKIIEVLA